MKSPTVSVVIPAYNEETHIAACLDAISRQTVVPYEVIVVDNNSTDQTVVIARRYPFVRVVREPRQGIVYARNAGFVAARGDIIGRIDVDTHVAPDWIAQLTRIFQDGSVDGVSGSIGFYDVPFQSLFSRADGLFRQYLARNLKKCNELFLFGGNMAIRRKVWQEVRHTLCSERAYHEDMDLAAHLAHSPYSLLYDKRLRVEVSARRIDSRFASYYPYVMNNSRTYAAHHLKGRYYMYPVEAMVVVLYAPLRLMYRSYDPEARRFSVARMCKPPYRERVSPVSELL